jgi:hypothetical protein
MRNVSCIALSEMFGAVPYRMRKEGSNIRVGLIQIIAKARNRAYSKIRTETDLQRGLQFRHRGLWFTYPRSESLRKRSVAFLRNRKLGNALPCWYVHPCAPNAQLHRYNHCETRSSGTTHEAFFSVAGVRVFQPTHRNRIELNITDARPVGV